MRVYVVAFVCSAATAHAAPSPIGRWSMNLELHYEAYPTMEMNIDRTLVGAAWFELTANGRVAGCLGQHAIEDVRVGKYQPPDYKDRHDHRDTRSLRALTGRWTATATGFDLELTAASWNSCTLSPTATFDPQIRLHCAAVTRLGKATVDCTRSNGGDIDGIGIRLATPPDSTNPMSDPRGDSMLLGRAPGLRVKVDQNAHTQIPRIITTVGATTLAEADFVTPHP